MPNSVALFSKCCARMYTHVVLSFFKKAQLYFFAWIGALVALFSR
jgi:hypothetical protein